MDLGEYKNCLVCGNDLTLKEFEKFMQYDISCDHCKDKFGPRYYLTIKDNKVVKIEIFDITDLYITMWYDIEQSKCFVSEPIKLEFDYIKFDFNKIVNRIRKIILFK